MLTWRDLVNLFESVAVWRYGVEYLVAKWQEEEMVLVSKSCRYYRNIIVDEDVQSFYFFSQ